MPVPSQSSPARIGIVGTGFMARGIATSLRSAGYQIERTLTRRSLASLKNFPFPTSLTQSIDDLVERCDILVECSGDSVHATDAVDRAFQAGVPVVTLNCEFQVTTGSWFVGKGLLTEAEGDQPGCLASLRREALSMGFKPLVYGNIKGYLNHAPRRDDMEYWSAKQGISLAQTTSFTDGTKVQIEQAFAANAFGADIYRPGLIGLAENSIEKGGNRLGDIADQHGAPLSDYLLSSGAPGVFITASHNEFNRPYLSYLKMGDGPYYTLIRNYHLCHLEVTKTVREVLEQGTILMDNSDAPRVSVNTLAKRDLKAGLSIPSGIGSFDVRGEAVEIIDQPDHAPIGLVKNARLLRDIAKGEPITMSDLELPDSLALSIWRKLLENALSNAA